MNHACNSLHPATTRTCDFSSMIKRKPTHTPKTSCCYLRLGRHDERNHARAVAARIVQRLDQPLHLPDLDLNRAGHFGSTWHLLEIQSSSCALSSALISRFALQNSICRQRRAGEAEQMVWHVVGRGALATSKRAAAGHSCNGAGGTGQRPALNEQDTQAT